MLVLETQTDLKVRVDEEIRRIRQEVDATLVLIARVKKGLSRLHDSDLEVFVEEVRLARNEIDDALTLIANVKKRLKRLHPNSANYAGSPVQFLTREVGEFLPQLAAVSYPPLHARPSTESVTTLSSTPSCAAFPTPMRDFAVRYFQITILPCLQHHERCLPRTPHQLHKRRLLHDVGERGAAPGINDPPSDAFFLYGGDIRTGLIEDHCTDTANRDAHVAEPDRVLRISEDTLNEIHERMNVKWEQLCKRMTGLPLLKFGWVDRYTGERHHGAREEEGVLCRWTVVE